MLTLYQLKKLLADSGFDTSDSNMSSSNDLLQLLALNSELFENGKYAGVNKIQSILRNHGIRVNDDDPAIMFLMLHNIVLQHHENDVIDACNAKYRAVKKSRNNASSLLIALGVSIIVNAAIFSFADKLNLVAAFIVGILLTGAFSYFWYKNNDGYAPEASPPESVISEITPRKNASAWTQDKIRNLMTQEIGTCKESWVKAASKVLIENSSVETAAIEAGLWPGILSDIIAKIRYKPTNFHDV